MSTENYACHLAPRGGKVDLIVDAIMAERCAAERTRSKYAESKGAIGVYANESTVSGLVFAVDVETPPGWKLVEHDGKCRCVIPKAKSRKAADVEACKAAQKELRSLPSLPGATKFTQRIGSDLQVVWRNGRHHVALCFFERIGEQTFVLTPWTLPREMTAEGVEVMGEDEVTKKNRIAFLPEGCERVGLSVYFAAKEAAEAKS